MKPREPRRITTAYYDHKGKIIKLNHAKWANNAVLLAISHLQINQYGADVAEVYDENDGVLHAVLRRMKSNELRIIYKREVKEGM